MKIVIEVGLDDSQWRNPEDVQAVADFLKAQVSDFLNNTKYVTDAGTYEAIRFESKMSLIQVPAGIDDSLWQELAKNGNTIAAVKQLRAQTGLGLFEAKDVVNAWASANGYNTWGATAVDRSGNWN